MRKHLAVLAVLVCLSGCSSNDAVTEEPTADFVADASIPEYDLLNGVLQIDFDRRHGESQGYALVPATRPPGLLGMVPGGSDGEDGSTVVNYRFGEPELNALVELAPQPTGTCETVTADGMGLCVRDDVTGTTNVTVYLTAGSGTAPKAGEPVTDEATAFWAKTPMVPIGEAAWVTDLLTRGRAAAQK